ncbi:MAG TPA: hypothetical protein VJV76_05715 [Gaiellaceae bacterium]|nr:hypothetical protein [Gaiellaceae bacterium]
MKMRSRVAAVVVGVVGLFGATAGVAFAHECFNASRSAQADQMIARHSKGHFDLQTSQFYALFLGTPCDPTSGQCPPVPANVQPLIDAQITGALDPDTVVGVILGFAPESALGSPEVVGAYDALVGLSELAATDAACLGVPTHYVTNSNSTMAAGAPEKVVTNGKGVEHFPDLYGNQLFQAYGTVLATGQTLDCNG